MCFDSLLSDRKFLRLYLKRHYHNAVLEHSKHNTAQIKTKAFEI